MELWSTTRWASSLELPEADLARWTDAIAEKLDA
jgi:hypothetical protein